MADEMASVRCVGCGGLFPALDGPTHRYMESSPGCWHAYGEVLAREYTDRAFWVSHRLTTDTYAAQHPGQPSAQSIQSVGGHLVSLHLMIERSATADHAARALVAAVAGSERFTWLTPPASMGAITVADVHAANERVEHNLLVRRWAESTWHAWREHHDTIRRWAADL